MSEHYQGSCHCGAIRFRFEGEEITKGLRCNCSICSRKGAMMSPEAIPTEKSTIEAAAGAPRLYLFGLKPARHYFWYNCGV